QPDWPLRTTVTGFVYYDRLGSSEGVQDELHTFLAAGAAPVVFTLGSSAVLQAESFFYESALAAKQAGLRAVLLTGKGQRPRLPERIPDSIFVTEYAPYSELLPAAAAIVH